MQNYTAPSNHAEKHVILTAYCLTSEKGCTAKSIQHTEYIHTNCTYNQMSEQQLRLVILNLEGLWQV